MRLVKKYISSLPIEVKCIVLVNLTVYLMTLFAESFMHVRLQDTLGAYPTYSEKFNVLSLFTSMFVHSNNVLHILVNLTLFLVFAPAVVRKIGSKLFILSIAFCGLLGYFFVNYTFHVNKQKIENSIVKVGLEKRDIKVMDGVVDEDYIAELPTLQKQPVREYNRVISKTYGASSYLFGVIALYLILFLLDFKKIFFVLVALYFLGSTVYDLSLGSTILNSSAYAHLGGALGGLLIYFLFKLKKDAIRVL